MNIEEKRSQPPATPSPGTGGIRLLASGCCCLLLLSSCLTVREELSDVRSSVKIGRTGKDQQVADAGGSDKLRKRFLYSGYEKGEDGQLRPKDSNLFGDKKFGRGRDFDKKSSRMAKREVESKYFKTPEYVERQQYRTESAREADLAAREGAFDDNRAGEAGRVANTKAKSGFLASLNPFKTKGAKESNRVFRTRADRQAARAQKNTAKALGVSQSELGFYSDTVNTMDDVKRLLHPEAFD